MCLSPNMPKAPEPTPPPPESVIQGKLPTTVKAQSTRETMRQASKGPAGLTIPLSTGTVGSAPQTTSMANLSIGGR
jgi:hypothetical protein